MGEDLFGRRLRAERERRRITLESIAENYKISVGLLKDLECDEMGRWPAGIFRRSFIRSYATAIGLDPDETMREFLELYPDPPQNGEMFAAPAQPSVRRPPTKLRLTLADTPRPFSGGRLLVRVRSRLAAAAWDAGAMLALALLAFLVLDRFWAPLGIMILCYQVGSILILGNTPGVYLFAPKGSGDAHPGSAPPATDEEMAEAAPSSIFHRRVTL